MFRGQGDRNVSLPENTISPLPVISDFLYPDSLPFEKLRSYELGGVNIRDTSQGYSSYVWYVEYKQNQITVNREPGYVYLIKEYVENVSTVDMAFDQNLNPIVCWSIGQHSYLYWFDVVTQTNKTTTFANTRDPRLTMDDKRSSQVLSSDVLFCYVNGNGDLVYRQQRERYTVERVLRSGIPEDVTLERVGMTVGNRIKFKFSTRYLLPSC